MAKKVEKENEAPAASEKKRCRWDAPSDAALVGQLLAEKAAGNQTDNAGWHSAAWTSCARAVKGTEKKSGGAPKTAEACQTRWGSLKAQFQLVKSLRNKSGWGWDDVEKHVVVSDDVWNAYLEINAKIHPWRNKGFPLYDEMCQLVDGAVATGEGAFIPGQAPNSPEWGPIVSEDEDDNSMIDPILLGPAGRVEPSPRAPQTPAAPSDEENSEMDEVPAPVCIN
ncbi:hypothetical protein B0H16DRAFT_1419396 [Mycena metata]|uniref:Myb/SANT-like domain-containing protein n=1 Tax=Mycena metata TaxID=1033252 RepID=A0AAD7N9P0_9AGAR|nr:hypothetical protein B0H16DRAFT_1419396 [Mycena metata]